MRIILLIVVFFLSVSSGYAKIPVQLNQKAKPIKFGDDIVYFACNGNMNKKLLDTLYVFSKKYALKNGVNAPSRNICQISIVKLRSLYSIGVSFYEKNPPASLDGVSGGVTTSFNINKLEKNDTIWMLIFDYGRQVGSGVCINSSGEEVDNSNC